MNAFPAKNTETGKMYMTSRGGARNGSNLRLKYKGQGILGDVPCHTVLLRGPGENSGLRSALASSPLRDAIHAVSTE